MIVDSQLAESQTREIALAVACVEARLSRSGCRFEAEKTVDDVRVSLVRWDE